jgi:hypothetical protein
LPFVERDRIVRFDRLTVGGDGRRDGLRGVVEASVDHRQRRHDLEQLVVGDGAPQARIVRDQVPVRAERALDEVDEPVLIARVAGLCECR